MTEVSPQVDFYADRKSSVDESSSVQFCVKQNTVSITGAGTKYNCRIYYSVGANNKMSIHACFMLEAGGKGFQYSNKRNGQKGFYKYMLVHNMPKGVFFVPGNTESELYGKVESFGPTFMEPAKGTVTFAVSTLIEEINRDLKRDFKTSSADFFNDSITNCLQFCRRMLRFISQYPGGMDDLIKAKITNPEANLDELRYGSVAFAEEVANNF